MKIALSLANSKDPDEMLHIPSQSGSSLFVFKIFQYTKVN